MLKAKVFQSDKGTAILIPDELRTKQTEMNMNGFGNFFALWPTNDPWYPIKQTAGTFPEDFMTDREQPV
ncbi:MAG: hypothetical protein IJM82_04325 [Synergistaceae bacterium]|nr:hypothetical protein [Synergistaceae bacterium]MBQ6737771.1 hypothetical protein [Synergistaceae bacterium]MBQ7068370.1 hypothetical protein [Synergistaceae bacterium]MBR0234592.1 hypothetical protein [Synergistaceae bacterium]MBR0317612.1 hypothetical protein [Synergistaceae bacterium]